MQYIKCNAFMQYITLYLYVYIYILQHSILCIDRYVEISTFLDINKCTFYAKGSYLYINVHL